MMVICAWPGLGLTAKESQALEAVSPQSGAILGVDEFMKNVDRHQGTVRLEGVVSALAKDRQALLIVDTREFQACGVITCAQLTLPVRWTGPMPSLRNIVRLTGEVQQISGKLLFNARTLEEVVPPKEAK